MGPYVVVDITSLIIIFKNDGNILSATSYDTATTYLGSDEISQLLINSQALAVYYLDRY